MYLTTLADVLRNAGLKVVEVDGWKTRGRGPMTAIKTIAIHHTAGNDDPKRTVSLPVVTKGRPGINGPLSQLYLSPAGVWYVVAAGRANHAGVVGKTDWDNWHAIGIEAEEDGVSSWSKVQMDSYVKGVRALAAAYKVSNGNILGHKEIARPKGRKGDPNFDMGKFRAAVKAPTPKKVVKVIPKPKPAPKPAPKPTPKPAPKPAPKPVVKPKPICTHCSVHCPPVVAPKPKPVVKPAPKPTPKPAAPALPKENKGLSTATVLKMAALLKVPAPAGGRLSPTLVKAMQVHLNAWGRTPLPLNGVITTAMVVKWQRHLTIPDTGVWSPAVVAAITKAANEGKV